MSDQPAPQLPKAYDPATVEPDLYADWVGAGLFHAEPDDRASRSRSSSRPRT
jgi:hypothetical protein